MPDRIKQKIAKFFFSRKNRNCFFACTAALVLSALAVLIVLTTTEHRTKIPVSNHSTILSETDPVLTNPAVSGAETENNPTQPLSGTKNSALASQPTGKPVLESESTGELYPTPETESSGDLVPTSEPEKSQSFVSEWNIAKTAGQIISVLASGTAAEVSMHEKDVNGLWHEIMSTSGYVGTGGVGTASESSPATPQGIYTLTQAFGVCPDPGTSLPYVQVNDSHYWVDDPNSQYYNRFVSTNNVDKDWISAEHLLDSPSAYAYAIAIDYNLDCVPGAGSAFFLHCSTGEPTFGCVSVPRDDMVFILQNITENAYIVIDRK